MKADSFQAPDYYNLDDLLSEEHKLVRSAARDWVKRDISPIINDYAQKAEFPTQIIGGLADIGAFGPYIPTEYGGAGLDQISYGLIMQEIERGEFILSIGNIYCQLVVKIVILSCFIADKISKALKHIHDYCSKLPSNHIL